MTHYAVQKPIKVTVSDPETGEELESRIVSNDYILICAGNRFVKSIQVMGRTHMIAVAVDRTPLKAASAQGATK